MPTPQRTPQGRNNTSTGRTNPFETPRMVVSVMGSETGSDVVMVRDTFGNEFTVNASIRPKAMGFPKTGERWLMEKISGRWLFAFQIDVPQPKVILGDRAGMHPVVKQMLDAMAASGLVVDLTTDSDPVDPPLDDTTDPAPVDPGGEPFIDAVDGDDYWETGEPEEAVTPVDSAVDDDPIPGSKVAADLLTATTYNLAFWVGPERAKRDLKRLYKFSDVISLQECSLAHRTAPLEARPDNWGMFRPDGAGKSNPILWNKDVLALVDSGTQQIVASDGPATFRPARAVNWVVLRHKATNVTFVEVNFHWEARAAAPGFLAPSLSDSPRNIERYRTQISTVPPLLADLGKKYPVLLNGDFNVRAQADLRLRNPGMPTATLGRIGMRSNWEQVGLPAIGTIGSHGTVFDWQFLSNTVPGQMKFVSSKVMRGYRSDHRPVVSKIRIKNYA